MFTFDKACSDLAIDLSHRVGVELVRGKPGEIIDLDLFWLPAIMHAAAECMQGHPEMGISVIIYAEFVFDLNFNADLFADFSLQAAVQVFPRFLFPTGKFPQSAKQSISWTLRDQITSVLLDHSCCNGEMRDLRARLYYRARTLQIEGVSLADCSQWAISAAG
jgi:hypothetical protein